MRSLLIVDDNEGVRESLRMILQERYRILTAATGAQALKAPGADAALVDRRLPDMPGEEVVARLKRRKPGMLCIAMSGDDEPMPGADASFTKPLPIPELLSLLKRRLG